MKFDSANPTATKLSSADSGGETLRFSEPHATSHGLQTAPDGLEPLARDILLELGEDPSREGLLKTPHRVAKVMRHLTSGYGADPWKIMGGALFDAAGYAEMVLVKDVEFYSLCEHHLLPFFGRVSVAYIPDGKIVGLSKIPRLVDALSRRLQVQERFTAQIADAMDSVLKPKGVAVAVAGFHLCMAMRGVAKQGSVTSTAAFRGAFEWDPARRGEFARLAETSGEVAWTRKSFF